MFQSTHPRRVWLEEEKTPQIENPGFNPHTHAGCDTIYPVHINLSPLFQSTHPRRVWPFKDIERIQAKTVSIHTPTQGVTMTKWQLIWHK